MHIVKQLKLKTMEKKMYALTYCYEGTDNTAPYGATLAVSTDFEKLKSEMEKCVAEDCEFDENDKWADDKNFVVYARYDTEIALQHRTNINIYAKYTIRSVDVL